MTEKLSNCPFCNRTRTAALVSVNAIRDDEQPHFAFCWKCGRRTMTYSNAKKAARSWNSLFVMKK